LPLITPFQLNTNGSYLVGIRAYGISATKKVRIRKDKLTEQPIQTTFVLATGNSSSLNWGWIRPLPAIRLNVQAPDIGKNEITAGGVKLYQNRPNPFTENTFVDYEIIKSEDVTLEVFDITGKKVVSIAEGNKSAGHHTIAINKALMPGVYFYTGDYSLTKKMTVMK
jgi:hypothetical protein